VVSDRSRFGQEHLTKGDIVTIPAGQANSDDTKTRPYLILWEAETDTYTLCPITSKPNREHKIALECRDMQSGALTYDPSYIRPNLPVTLSRNESWRKIGAVKEEKMTEVAEKIKTLADQQRVSAPVSKALERPTRQRIR
jgi:mRNA-degrading endonuclease toxin of MazEF toxin-antitoxin module